MRGMVPAGSPFSSACLTAGCPEPVTSRGRCARHGGAVDRLRGLNADRVHVALYDSARWRRLRRAVLMAHPICECDVCRQTGRVLSARVVHHKRPHGGDAALFFDETNLQALAKACHDRLTAGGVQFSGATRFPTPAPGVARVAGGSGQGPDVTNRVVRG